jgi:hypothetical protein
MQGQYKQLKKQLSKMKRRAMFWGVIIGLAVSNIGWLSTPYLQSAYYDIFPVEYTAEIILGFTTLGPSGPGYVEIFDTGEVIMENVPVNEAAVLFWQAAALAWPLMCIQCFEMLAPEAESEKEFNDDRSNHKIATTKRY